MNIKFNLKKILAVFILICSIIMYGINSIDVWGIDAGIGGGSYVPGSYSSSGSTYIDTSVPQTRPIAYGFRVSIIDKNGNLAEVNGIETHSVDYWSSWGYHNGSTRNKQLGYKAITSSASYGTYSDANNWMYYNTPKPKTINRDEKYIISKNLDQTYMNNVKESTYVDNNKYEAYKIKLTSGGNSTGGDRRIGNNYARIALEVFSKDIENENIDFMYTFLKDCGMYGNSDAERAVNAKKYYLLVEPLTAIYTNNDVTFGYVALGTPSDLQKMGVLENYSAYVYDYFMYINPVIFNTLEGGPINSCPGNTNNSRSKISGNGCVGAFTMYIGDIVNTNDCNEDARAIISSSDYSESNYIDKLYGTAETPNIAIRQECFTDPNNKNTFDKENCYQLLPEYVSKVGIASNKDSSGKEQIDVCKPISCNDALAYSPKIKASEFDKNSTLHLDDFAEYINSTSASAYDKGIYYLKQNAKNFFTDGTKTALLEYENYMQLSRPASCEGIPDCPTGNINATCDVNVSNGNHIVLSDSSNTEGCLVRGYAYNNLSKSDKFQTSYDSRYDINENKGYCKETVTFDLPKKPETAEAGTLLKWGTAGVEETGKFGTMTVTRTCWYGGSGLNNKGTKIDLSWIDTINPKITLHYRDALPIDVNWTDDVLKSYERNTPNDLTLSEPYNITIYDINGVSGTGGNISTQDYVASKGYSWGKESFTSVKNFSASVTYDIEYGDNFKWYIDKSSNTEYVDKDKVEKNSEDKPEPQYIFIGYGLPTTFVTPTCNDFGSSSEGIEKGNGYLYVTIKNIGTFSGRSGYHFNNLIKWNLTDDATNSETGLKDSYENEIVYSCNFNVENKLFGYENGKECFYTQPVGLDIIFRTIELIDNKDDIDVAFPGRSGNGRTMGDNWNQLFKEDIDYLIKLLSPKIYEEEPLYHIELTPSKIREIRINNKELRDNSIDPYTGKGTIKDKDNDIVIKLYVYSANELAAKTEDELKNFSEPEDCSESTDISACNRTNNYNKLIGSRTDKYKKDKENLEKGELYYNPYTYAASEFLTTLYESSGLTGLCMNTYGNDTALRSKYYAKYEGCYSNILLNN